MDLVKILDPTGERKKEFYSLLAIVENSPWPKADYPKLGHADLITLQILARIFEIQTSYVLLLRTFAVLYGAGIAPKPIIERGGLTLQEVRQWGHDLDIEKLFEAYCAYPESLLITFLLDVKTEGVLISQEVASRLELRPFTAEMVLLEAGHDDRLTNIESLLVQSRRGGYDTKRKKVGEAITKAWEEWKIPGKDLSVGHALPAFPLDAYLTMLPAEREFWEGPMTRAWEAGRKTALQDFVSKLKGGKESIPKIALNYTEAKRKGESRQKKIRNRSGTDIATEIHSRIINPEQYLEEKQDLEEAISLSVQAYKIAQKRSGKEGEIFLDALKAGKNVVDAAASAKIDRRTGYRILQAIKKTLPPKNPL